MKGVRHWDGSPKSLWNLSAKILKDPLSKSTSSSNFEGRSSFKFDLAGLDQMTFRGPLQPKVFYGFISVTFQKQNTLRHIKYH